MTIRTYPFLDEHSNCRNPAAVSSIYAAAGLGISTKTLARLRRLGFILAFSVPSRIPGKQMWRYRVEDLLAFSRKQRNHIRAWDPHTDSDLPAIIVSKVLGVSLQDVYIQKHRGRLKDYRPETVRSYLTNNNKREVIREIKQELKSKLSTLRAEVRRLQRLLKSMNCPGCPKGLSE